MTVLRCLCSCNIQIFNCLTGLPDPPQQPHLHLKEVRDVCHPSSCSIQYLVSDGTASFMDILLSLLQVLSTKSWTYCATKTRNE